MAIVREDFIEGGEWLPIPTMKSNLTWLLTLGGAESCNLDGKSSMSNGRRSGGSMAAGFSIEKEEELKKSIEGSSWNSSPWKQQQQQQFTRDAYLIILWYFMSSFIHLGSNCQFSHCL